MTEKFLSDLIKIGTYALCKLTMMCINENPSFQTCGDQLPNDSDPLKSHPEITLKCPKPVDHI